MLKLHDYQRQAFAHALEHPGCGWFLDPGLGKTILGLKLIHRVKLLQGSVSALVVGPLRVVRDVWQQEAEEWGIDLSFELAHKRISTALKRNADVTLINHDSLRALAKLRREWDIALWDESTAFKNWTSKRTKAARSIICDRSVLLTGTPASESYIDLFSQVYLIDGGERLGKNITEFRRRYCRRGGFNNYEWLLREGAEEEIRDAISDICLYQSAVDHLDMPDTIHNEIPVKLGPKARQMYDDLLESMLTDLNGAVTAILEPGGVYAKSRQLAGGAFYDERREVVEVDEGKLDALEDLYAELNGKRLLVAYNFAHEWDRIQQRFPGAKHVDGKVKDVPQDWTMLACQVQALSHGVNGLQKKCSDVCWFSLTNRRETFDQFNTRVFRQGQRDDKVRFHYLLAKGTIDRALLRALRSKGKMQQELLNALKKDDELCLPRKHSTCS